MSCIQLIKKLKKRSKIKKTILSTCAFHKSNIHQKNYIIALEKKVFHNYFCKDLQLEILYNKAQCL